MKLLILALCNLMGGFVCYSQIKKTEMAEAFQQGHYGDVIQIAERILSIDSNDVDARLGMARAYNQEYAFAKAIPNLKKVLETGNEDWQLSWADIELMVSYYALGDLQQARNYHEKARMQKGTENSDREIQRLDRLFGFDELYNDWKTIETKDIVFHFEASIDSNLIAHIVRTRQIAFDSINAFFHALLPKKIDFFVWKSGDIYNKYLESKLGFTRPAFCLSHNGPYQSYGHEIAHSISFWASRDKISVRFINEGIGVCFNQNEQNKMAEARAVFKAHAIDIKDLWKNSNVYNESILYPIAGAFVQYLINFNKTLFLELNNNQTYENACVIYGNQLDVIIDQFTHELKERP